MKISLKQHRALSVAQAELAKVNAAEIQGSTTTTDLDADEQEAADQLESELLAEELRKGIEKDKKTLKKDDKDKDKDKKKEGDSEENESDGESGDDDDSDGESGDSDTGLDDDDDFDLEI